MKCLPTTPLLVLVLSTGAVSAAVEDPAAHAAHGAVPAASAPAGRSTSGNAAAQDDHAAHRGHRGHGTPAERSDISEHSEHAEPADPSAHAKHEGHTNHANDTENSGHAGYAGHGSHADHIDHTSHTDHASHASHANHTDHASPRAADPHAGHGSRQAPLPYDAALPAPTDADRAAAVRPASGHAAHDDHAFGYLLFDRLEHQWEDGGGGQGTGWAVKGWHGTDLRRWWLRAEGEHHGGHDDASIELLRGRSLSPWWDLVAGFRHDAGDAPSRTLAAIGLQGIAPGHVEVAATLYAGQGGQAGVAFDAEYDLRLTNRLILQAHAEAEAWTRRDRRRDTGAGLDSVEAGLRLRYEVRREFAPYVGLAWERRFGDAADHRRAAGEDTSELRWVAGLRFWF